MSKDSVIINSYRMSGPFSSIFFLLFYRKKYVPGNFIGPSSESRLEDIGAPRTPSLSVSKKRAQVRTPVPPDFFWFVFLERGRAAACPEKYGGQCLLHKIGHEEIMPKAGCASLSRPTA
ncbi:MAG: hypothetical protein ACOC6L_04925, partial [Thermodesulfobacteriota bacterium]